MSELAAMVAPVARRVRAYFAPVNRAMGTPTIFDAAQSGRFVLDSPPSPWIDLGWCRSFHRSSGDGSKSGITALRTGAPALVSNQVRTDVEATVGIEFNTWGKLQMALACGSQQMNLLATAIGATPNGSGGTAAAPVSLLSGSTASLLQIGSAASGFSAGDLVSVDVDYTGQTGYVGSGVSGAYLRSNSVGGGDVNYIRRISLNVGRVSGIANGALQLEAPLLAGAPTQGMRVSRMIGFVDREGGSFFQEWSGLFVVQGEQGDRVIYHYPRLQTMQGAAEAAETIVAPFERIRLAGAFRALPVVDVSDGEKVLCFRSYLPA